MFTVKLSPREGISARKYDALGVAPGIKERAREQVSLFAGTENELWIQR